MGTRALVDVKDEEGQTLVTIYRQFDGYPKTPGLGAELKAIAKGAKLCNGFSMDQEAPNWFNGMACFAAYLVGELKGKKIGNVYLLPPGTRDCGEEYVYTVHPVKDRIKIETFDVYKAKKVER